jgi:hypothetical protein
LQFSIDWDNAGGMTKTWRGMQSGFGWFCAAVLLLAVVARASVPSGYMLAPSEDGRFVAITLCTGAGAVDALLDTRTGKLAEAADHSGDADPTGGTGVPCSFATLAYAALPDVPSVAHGASFAALPPSFLRADDVPHVGAASSLPWATGPPHA